MTSVCFNKILFLVYVCVLLFTSALDDEPKQRSHLRRNKGHRKGKKRFKDNDGDSIVKQLNAVSVYYPVNVFGDKSDWRNPATFDAELKRNFDKDSFWTELSKAQDQEDIWLYENWFFGMKNGVIIESGALDGILFSNSYLFENAVNWTAIHVEADPENFNNLKYNRPNAVNINGALCSESRPLHYSSEGVIPVRGFIEFMTESFIKKWHGRVYNNKTRIEDLPTVQCVPMRHLLRQLDVKHVDIWILDVEGAEESVLRGTDFNAVRFNAVAMECDEHDIVKNSRKTDILEANGFKCLLVERNCMCKHDSYQPSSRKEKTLLKKFDGRKWSKTYVNKGFTA